MPELRGAGILGAFSLWPISMRRMLFLAHRYLGIAVGSVMVLWCLSGFVMMYMPYPSLSLAERLAGSPPLDLSECCDTERIQSLGLVDVYGFTVEMLAHRPVLRIDASGGQAPVLDLASGERIEGIDGDAAVAIAWTFKERSGIGGDKLSLEPVQRDQWTVTRSYDAFRPLYRVSANDLAGTEWYLASTTGQVVQLTTASERFWNWLGAVPHWLYPVVLRQHGWLWSQVVIWLSLAGAFLTLMGLYIGFTQFRRGRSRRSPYRGTALWHHYAGLLFGIFVLTWVSSGFISMNPWGMFDFSGGEAARQRLQGVPLHSGELSDFLRRLPAAELPGETVQLKGYTLRGQLYVLAYVADGSVVRLEGKSLQESPLGPGDWPSLVAAVAGTAPVAEAGLIEREDAYYYTGHDLQAQLPVYRVIRDDAERTRIYLDARSGEVTAYFDRSQQLYRWLFSGLHSLDFSHWLRARPFWDLLVWFLMLGVSAATLTGAYMGVKRLLR